MAVVYILELWSLCGAAGRYLRGGGDGSWS